MTIKDAVWIVSANEEDVVLKREVMVSAAPYVRVVPVSKERAVEIRGGRLDLSGFAATPHSFGAINVQKLIEFTLAHGMFDNEPGAA